MRTSLTSSWRRSGAMIEAYGVTEATPWRDATRKSPHIAIPERLAALGQDPDMSRWSGRSISQRAVGSAPGGRPPAAVAERENAVLLVQDRLVCIRERSLTSCAHALRAGMTRFRGLGGPMPVGMSTSKPT